MHTSLSAPWGKDQAEERWWGKTHSTSFPNCQSLSPLPPLCWGLSLLHVAAHCSDKCGRILPFIAECSSTCSASTSHTTLSIDKATDGQRLCLHRNERCDCSTCRHSWDSFALASSSNDSSGAEAMWTSAWSRHLSRYPGPGEACAAHAEARAAANLLLQVFVLASLKRAWQCLHAHQSQL